ncbi:hypothetical protein FO519_002522 [Halicephalobus sp. NKZ332]|nr:hypothetical protein FO519_002522 [Halicephalobus sp. NKZ332]
MLSRSRSAVFLLKRQLPGCLSSRWKNDDQKLTEEQKAKLLSKLSDMPKIDKVAKSETNEYFELTTDAEVQKEMDEIRARGFLKFNKPYDPPADIENIVKKIVESVYNDVSDWKSVALNDLKSKFKVLNELGANLNFHVPNSDLCKLKTVADVVDFYSIPRKNLTKYAEMARDDSLPENLKIREHPVRFHPNDIESHHGGITAYPGEGGKVISLRNKRLYRSFKPKKEWYDYEDQNFDYTPPDKGMPWDTEVSQKMDRYVDRNKRTAFNRKTTNYQAWKEQMTICELLDGYDPAVRPFGNNPHMEKRGPVVIRTSLRIRSISAVSERNMEYIAQFRFQQEWFDERLRFTHLSEFRNFEFINVAKDQKLWIPDTFFQNERNGWYHMLDQENRFVKIRSDGKVFYNRRLTLILACNMNLLKYPMDVQKCLIDFASYAYTANDIVYEWDNNGIIMLDSVNGALPNFVISHYSNATCDSVTNTGTYSCLRVELTLDRVFSFFLLQLYIPSAMLVGVSWVSYWIDWKSTAARVPLAIVTLLTMIVTHHSVNSNLPPVSYSKAIDVWIGSCGMFIFASLIEYAVVNYMGILEEHRQMRKIAMNRTRLSNVATNTIENESKDSLFSGFFGGKRSSEKKGGLLRRNRKLRLSLQYEQDENMELQSVAVQQQIRQNEPDWTTVQEFNDLVYVGQRKRVELIRWCSLLSSRGKAERIDIVARMVFPVAFILFNCAYWSLYLSDIIDTSVP